jgi:hypothetical protein
MGCQELVDDVPRRGIEDLNSTDVTAINDAVLAHPQAPNVSGGANVHRSWRFENDQADDQIGVAVLP